jgi:hypothetical protein
VQIPKRRSEVKRKRRIIDQFRRAAAIRLAISKLRSKRKLPENPKNNSNMDEKTRCELNMIKVSRETCTVQKKTAAHAKRTITLIQGFETIP